MFEILKFLSYAIFFFAFLVQFQSHFYVSLNISRLSICLYFVMINFWYSYLNVLFLIIIIVILTLVTSRKQ